MKVIQKVGSMALALVMALSGSVHAFAAEGSGSVDAALRSRGCPKGMLDKMSPTAKE